MPAVQTSGCTGSVAAEPCHKGFPVEGPGDDVDAACPPTATAKPAAVSHHDAAVCRVLKEVVMLAGGGVGAS